MRSTSRVRIRRACRGLLRSFALVALLASSGCAKHVVWSECPVPTPMEEEDILRLLEEEPEAPASGYLARVIGEVFGPDVDLDNVSRSEP